MRVAALALALVSLTGAALTGAACRRGALQPDAGGGGGLSVDAGGGGVIGGDAAGGDGATGTGTGPGTGTTTDAAPPTIGANCGEISSAGTYFPPAILVLLDQSMSGDPSSWSSLIVTLSNLVVKNDLGVDWGLYTFPEAGVLCGSGTFSPAIDIPVAPMNAVPVAAGIRAAGTDGRGAPTAAAIEAAAAYLRTLASDTPKYLMLVTDHAPDCALTNGQLSSNPPQAQADTLAAIKAAAMAGIPTIVVAPSTTLYMDDLNALAAAGGRPYQTTRFEFYTEQTIGDQFMPAARVEDCVFPNLPPPPVPGNVAVSLDGFPVSRDTRHMNGWDYTSSSNSGIQLFGDWCARLLAGGEHQLTLLYGCP